MRKFLIPLLAASALAVPSTALAGGHNPYPTPTPTPPVVTPTPPTPTNPIVLPVPVPLPAAGPVTDVPSAERFAARFAILNAASFLNQDGRRVRVTDVNSRCLQSAVVGAPFGCVFAFQAAIILRNNHNWGWDNRNYRARAARANGGHNPTPRRVRIARAACLGEIIIRGGATVTPQAETRYIQCGRIGGPPTATTLPTFPEDG